MKESDKLTVKVVGGVGNQLFCYFAGLSVSILRNLNLNVDVTDIRAGKVKHNSTIESLELPGNFVTRQKVSSKFLQLQSRIAKIVNGDFFEKVYKSKSYHSKSVGFDPIILAADSKINNISGYFQSYVYHDMCSGIVTNPRLRISSDWYREMSLSLRVKNVACMHIRRGDYINHANSHGLLSRDYYLNALDFIQSINSVDEVWIFSDDISEARNLLKNTKGRFHYIQPPPNSRPTESLLLMSQANSIVIANSTFSWWSAKFSSNEAIKVAPTKWFRGMPDPEKLLPENWHKVESKWL